MTKLNDVWSDWLYHLAIQLMFIICYQSHLEQVLFNRTIPPYDLGSTFFKPRNIGESGEID